MFSGPNFGGFGGYPQISAKTAAYTVKAKDAGKIFTTRGATAAVTFTLPTAADLPSGWSVTFVSAADVGMTVASAEGDNIVTFNDLAADSVAFSTASEIIGGAVTVVWDGTGFLTFFGHAGGHLQTLTVAT
ncbi:hypothetical protein KQH61_05985 [bacterium]|nr:hypothetical protein [bacterium]